MADGVVVGSAIVNIIARNGANPDLAAEVRRFVSALAEAVHAP
jgi:tryptophan synthase alpha subunit